MSSQSSSVPTGPTFPSTFTPQPSQQDPSDFKLFKPVSNAPSSLAESANLPDEYFTPTASDLKAAQSALAARTQALVNAPLQLRAVREAEQKAKRDRWPESRIRIKFTDRTQLEKVFPSSHKIRSVYAFVRSCLREDVKPIKFILYQPPKRDLKVSDPTVRDLTLADLQLAPSSILLLRFEDESLNHVDVPAPLSPFVLSHAVDLPIPVPSPEVESSSSLASKTPPSKPSSSGAKSAEAKMAKWLKLGQKK